MDKTVYVKSMSERDGSKSKKQTTEAEINFGSS